MDDTTDNENSGYRQINLPVSIVKLVDEILNEHPEYVSRSDFLKEAIRLHLLRVKEK